MQITIDTKFKETVRQDWVNGPQAVTKGVVAWLIAKLNIADVDKEHMEVAAQIGSLAANCMDSGLKSFFTALQDRGIMLDQQTREEVQRAWIEDPQTVIPVVIRFFVQQVDHAGPDSVDNLSLAGHAGYWTVRASNDRPPALFTAMRIWVLPLFNE